MIKKSAEPNQRAEWMMLQEAAEDTLIVLMTVRDEVMKVIERRYMIAAMFELSSLSSVFIHTTSTRSSSLFVWIRSFSWEGWKSRALEEVRSWFAEKQRRGGASARR